MPSTRRPAERLAGRLVTGPVAFGLAGAVDVLVILVLVVRYRITRRYHPPRDGL